MTIDHDARVGPGSAHSCPASGAQPGVVNHCNGYASELNLDCLGGPPRTHIRPVAVARHDGDLSKAPELVKQRRIADVARMQDVICGVEIRPRA